MTAKEQLLQRVQAFSEDEAADALRVLDRRVDALARLLNNAPEDDEPTSPEEDQIVQKALEAVARGEVISAEEIRREFA
jgi:O6-methylguanine-DNA--protein-cysteine methyltransferase